MKGKDIFTSAEIKKLEELIAARTKVSCSSEQKKIRSKMRKIGFYGSDFGIIDMTVDKFHGLIESGRIKISDSVQAGAPQSENSGRENTVSHSIVENCADMHEVERALVKGDFVPVNELDGYDVPAASGLYCIKLQAGVSFAKKFGKIRNNRVIYIGQASKSLRSRLWEEELNFKRPATFFRSIGAMLGYLPPKGSLVGRKSRNYTFSESDKESIREWMGRSLSVNFIELDAARLDEIEQALIDKYRPLVNIQHNPDDSAELRAARQKCLDYAKGVV